MNLRSCECNRTSHKSFTKSTLVHVIAWCRQATRPYQSQCWPRSLLLWVNYSSLVTPYGTLFRNCSEYLLCDAGSCLLMVMLLVPSRHMQTMYRDPSWFASQAITVTSQWARWRLKSPVWRLFTQPAIQAHIKENIKALCHSPLCGEWPVTRKMVPFDDIIMTGAIVWTS